MAQIRDVRGAGQASGQEQVVNSKDGTQIAFSRVGRGPTVILISGATADRRWNEPLAEALSSAFTVINYDRRGRGRSGDTLPYAVERELEDVEALIEEAGGSAHLYGISSGGALALEAAAAGLTVDRLAVYEVPYGLSDDQPRRHSEYVADLQSAAQSGRRGAMMEVFLRLAGADDVVMAATQASSEWPRIVEFEHTLLYDAACMGTGQPPFERLRRIRVPTCVITGVPEGPHEVGSVEFFEAAAQAIVDAIPFADHRRLRGQTHAVEASAIAPELAAFYKGRLVKKGSRR